MLGIHRQALQYRIRKFETSE
ncbi:hypothetical protein [Escherichia albertii]|nr:hypothetical protein [Escherichia albertii]